MSPPDLLRPAERQPLLAPWDRKQESRSTPHTRLCERSQTLAPHPEPHPPFSPGALAILHTPTHPAWLPSHWQAGPALQLFPRSPSSSWPGNTVGGKWPLCAAALKLTCSQSQKSCIWASLIQNPGLCGSSFTLQRAGRGQPGGGGAGRPAEQSLGGSRREGADWVGQDRLLSRKEEKHQKKDWVNG